MTGTGVMHRFARTGFLRLLLFPVSGVASLTGAGIIVRDVGLTEFGVISLIITLPLLIPFADLGISAVLVNAFSSGDIQKGQRLARLAWFVLWSSAAFILVAVICIERGFGWSHILGVSTSDRSSWIWIVFSIVMVSAIPFGIGQRILTGLDRVSLATGLQVIFPIVNVLLVCLVHLFRAPQLYIVTPGVSQLVSTAAIFAVAIRKADISFGSLFGSVAVYPGDLKRLLSTATPMFVVMVGLPLAFQSHRILLSHWSTGEELGSYAVAVALYVPAWSLVSAMGINLWPFFSRAREMKSENDARLVLYRIGAIFAGLGVVFASVFFLLAPIVTNVWSSVAVPTSLWAGFSLLLLVQTVQLPLGMFLTTPRMLAFQAACVALMATGTIGLARLFVDSLGALAPVLSSVVAVFLLQIVPGALYVLFSSSGQLSRRPQAALSAR